MTKYPFWKQNRFSVGVRRLSSLTFCAVLVLTVVSITQYDLMITNTNSSDSDYFQSKDFPHSRADWMVDTNLTVSNQTIFLEGDLIVTGTGGLTLEGVTLFMNNSYDGQYMIEVQNGGFLNITKGCIIRSINPNFGFMFWVRPGSHFVMRESLLREAGWDATNPGLILASSNSIVENNTIMYGYYGIRLSLPSKNTFVGNNTIIQNTVGIVLYLDAPSTNNLIYGNEIAYNGQGIRIDFSFLNVIEKNVIHSNSGVGIKSGGSGQWNIYGNNTLYNNLRGIDAIGNYDLLIGNNISSSRQEGIYVLGTNITLKGNQMWNNGVVDGYRMYYNLFVDGSDLGSYDQTIDSTNKVNGKPVYYFWNVHDQIYENLVSGHITFVYSTNVTLGNSTVIGGDSVYVSRSSYVTIVDCNSSYNFYGVHLWNSEYTTVSRNRLYGSNAGVLFFSDHHIIEYNTVIGNNVGISLTGSGRYNVIANNTVKLNRYNGITVQNDAFFNTVNDNMVESNGEHGIYFQNTFRNTVRRNTIVNSGTINLLVWTYNDVVEYFNHSIDTSNLVNGVPVRYYYGISNQVIENMNLTHLTVAGSSNVTVRNVNVSNGDPGYFAYTSGAKIESSEFSDGYYGMYLHLHSTVFIENSSIRDTRHLDFRIRKDVDATSLNSTFERGSLEIGSSDSQLTVKNYLHVKVLDPMLSSLSNVQVNASDNGALIHQDFTDINGKDRWIPVTDGVYHYLSSKPRYLWQENDTRAEVFFPGKDFHNPPDYPNPRDVNMSTSHWEFFYEKGAILPDYIPWNVTPQSPLIVLPGSLTPISAAVVNVGQNAATTPSVVVFYSETDRLNPFQSYPVGSLSVGEMSSDFPAIWKAPDINGIYNVTVEVDYNNDILESNETNNSYNILFIVASPPPPPTNVTTKVMTDANIMLEWDPPNSSLLDHYLIYRSTDQREFDFSSPVYNTSGDPDPLSTNWTDVDAAGSTAPIEYYYVVRAVNFLGMRSTTSNTAGKWTMSFDSGLNTFSLPLEPFGNQNISDYAASIPNVNLVRWMDSNGRWVNHYPSMGPGVNDSPAIIGEGYEISLASPTTYTFCGSPASMIRFQERLGDSVTFRKSLSAPIEGNDVNLSWDAISGANRYLVFRSERRDGLHDSPLSPIANTTETYWKDTGIIGNQKSEYYYVVIPLDSDGEMGSSTYSIGVTTVVFYGGSDTFALQLRPMENHTLDWYCDAIPDVAGMAYMIFGLWKYHAKEMPQGVYDVDVLQGEGYQISIDGPPSKLTFVGY